MNFCKDDINGFAFKRTGYLNAYFHRLDLRFNEGYSLLDRLSELMVSIHYYHSRPDHNKMNPYIWPLIVISLHFMQKPILPDAIGTKISNTKHQISNKSQITIFNDRNRFKFRMLIILIFKELMKKSFSVSYPCLRFWISDIVLCLVFDIYDLEFPVYSG